MAHTQEKILREEIPGGGEENFRGCAAPAGVAYDDASAGREGRGRVIAEPRNWGAAADHGGRMPSGRGRRHRRNNFMKFKPETKVPS